MGIDRGRCLRGHRLDENIASDVAQTFRMAGSGAVSGYDFALSFALLAIGHLVGLSVGIAMLIGRSYRLGLGRAHFSALTARCDKRRRDCAATTWQPEGAFHRRCGAIRGSAIWT